MSHPRRMRSLAKCQIKKIKRLFFSYNKEILLLSYRNSAHKGKNKPKMKKRISPHLYDTHSYLLYCILSRQKEITSYVSYVNSILCKEKETLCCQWKLHQLCNGEQKKRKRCWTWAKVKFIDEMETNINMKLTWTLKSSCSESISHSFFE